MTCRLIRELLGSSNHRYEFRQRSLRRSRNRWRFRRERGWQLTPQVDLERLLDYTMLGEQSCVRL